MRAALALVLRRRLHRLGQVRLAGVHGGDGAHHRGVVGVLVRAQRLLVARGRVGLPAAALQVALVRPLNQVVDQLRGGAGAQGLTGLLGMRVQASAGKCSGRQVQRQASAGCVLASGPAPQARH